MDSLIEHFSLSDIWDWVFIQRRVVKRLCYSADWGMSAHTKMDERWWGGVVAATPWHFILFDLIISSRLSCLSKYSTYKTNVSCCLVCFPQREEESLRQVKAFFLFFSRSICLFLLCLNPHFLFCLFLPVRTLLQSNNNSHSARILIFLLNHRGH